LNQLSGTLAIHSYRAAVVVEKVAGTYVVTLSPPRLPHGFHEGTLELTATTDSYITEVSTNIPVRVDVDTGITISPSVIVFPRTPIGGSESKTVSFRSSSLPALAIKRLSVRSTNDDRVDINCFAVTDQSHDRACVATVRFIPVETGAHTASLDALLDTGQASTRLSIPVVAQAYED
jgi:hypothetical protein